MPGYFFTTLGAMSIIQVIVAIGKLIFFHGDQSRKLGF